MEHAGQSPSEGDHGVHHLADKLTVNREMREVYRRVVYGHGACYR